MNDSSSLSQRLLQQLQGGGIEQIAQQLGTDHGQTQSAVASVLPLLMGALGRNAQQPGGADALLGALQRDHAGTSSGSGFDLGGLLGSVLGGGNSTAQTDGAGILGHIFGGNADQATTGVSQATGLDSSKSSQLLQLLAPIVMSFLAQHFLQKGNGDSAQLGQALGQEHQNAEAQGGLSALLGGTLDRDGDGQVGASDLLKIGSGLFGKQ